LTIDFRKWGNVPRKWVLWVNMGPDMVPPYVN
jgi:hypothetical protein